MLGNAKRSDGHELCVNTGLDNMAGNSASREHKRRIADLLFNLVTIDHFASINLVRENMPDLREFRRSKLPIKTVLRDALNRRMLKVRLRHPESIF